MCGPLTEVSQTFGIQRYPATLHQIATWWETAFTATIEAMPTSAYEMLESGTYRSSLLTRGPWHPQHQHAGPPIALVCRAFERFAAEHGLTHISRLTANLLRPVPIGELSIEVEADYVGRNAGHFSARLVADGKEVARFSALAQRDSCQPRTHSFVNSDLTIHLLRRPRGEWICLDARTHLGPQGCGLAESALYDVHGLIGRAAQSLAVSRRG